MAVKFGMSPNMEARFGRSATDAQQGGFSYQRFAPNFRQPFGHRHRDQEESYVVLSGSGQRRSRTRRGRSGSGTRSAFRRKRPARSRRATTVWRCSSSGPVRPAKPRCSRASGTSSTRPPRLTPRLRPLPPAPRAPRCRRRGTERRRSDPPLLLARRRNSRSIAKCLNSSPCAFSMIAFASASRSTEMRCSYQPIASASSTSDVIMRANVRVSCAALPAARGTGSGIRRLSGLRVDGHLLPARPDVLKPVPDDLVLRRAHLVEPLDGPRVRGFVDELRCICRLARDREHRVAEGVERLLRLRLGRLDHQRLGHDEREVHGRWMEPVVHQPLRDIERADAVLLLQVARAEHELVHAEPVVQNVVVVLQPREHVVRVQYRGLAHLAQARTV